LGSRETADLDLICGRVMDLDPKIRFVGVINERGKLLAGGLREGLSSLEEKG